VTKADAVTRRREPVSSSEFSILRIRFIQVGRPAGRFWCRMVAGR